MGIKDAKKDIYELAKTREIKIRNLKCLDCIRDENKKLMNRRLKKDRRSYFDKPLNEIMLEIVET